MKKRGQGISLETVITAAIVLIVLIVLWAIFTGRLQLFSDSVTTQDKECEPVCKAIGKVKANGNCVANSPNEVKTGCCCKDGP